MQCLLTVTNIDAAFAISHITTPVGEHELITQAENT